MPPCETARFTREQITAGNAELRRWFLEEAELDGWVPSGAVQLTRGVSGAPAGAPNPMTLIVSSEEPRIVYGFVPEDLPACGGEPVGIE